MPRPFPLLALLALRKQTSAFTIRPNVRDCPEIEPVNTKDTKALLNGPFPMIQFRPENVAFSLSAKENKHVVV